MINSGSKSNRLLASRRYTHDSYTDSQESFTNVLDLQASEIYTQANKIPSSGLPFSSSADIGSYYTDGGDNILRYWWRHKLTKSNLNNEVWFFLNPTGSSSGIGAQLIDSNQQTNFISPKYSVSSLANATTEDTTPGYLAKVFVSSTATSASVSDSDVISVNNYTFDYKTGVVQFLNSSLDPSDSQYVYMSVYQYVGKTLAEGIELTGDISGSASSTGSFGHLVVQGNITASGTVRADAFESVTGGDTIDFKDSVSVTGDVNADNLTADSSSFSTRVTNLKIDSGSFSTRITNLVADSASFSTRITTAEGELENTLISASKQLDDQISGSFGAPSASFSTRITNLVADSASFSTRITITENELENTLISASKQLDDQISGSFGAPSASFSTRITNLKIDSGSISTRLSDVEAGSTSKTLVSSSAQIADEISGSFTSTSASISIRLSDVEAGSTSKTLVSSSAQIADEISGSFTSTSASISERLSSVEAGSTSKTLVSSSAQIADEISGSFTQDSASFSTRLTTEESNVDALQIDSASFSVRLSDVEAGSTSKTLVSSSAQIADEISGSFTQDSASFSTRITNLKIDSGSISDRLSDVEAGSTSKTLVSSSAQIADEISGSFIAPSSSFSSRITTLEGSGDIQSLGTTDNVLFANITASGDVVVQGKLTAQEIHTEIESSSIIFTSGSTKFGDTSDDKHEFTGSILVKGNLTAENLTADSSSFSTRTTVLEQASASFSTRVTTAEQELENTIISSSEQLSNQISGSFTALSASFSNRITADSSSFSTRTTILEATSASFSTRITTTEQELENTIISASEQLSDQISGSFTAPSASFSIRVTNVEITASSFLDGTANLVSGSAVSTGSFGMIKKDGLDIREHFSRNTVEAFELDSNGDFQPTDINQYMVDPKWELDSDGNLQRRERELWTFNWDDYFSD